MNVLAFPPGLIVGWGTIAALQLNGTAGALAAILGLLTGLASVIGILFGVKYRVAYAVEVKAREGEAALNDALEDRIRTLAHEREDLGDKLQAATETIAIANKTIAKLEPLEGVGKVLELVTRSFERMVGRQEEMHRENRAAAERLQDSVDRLVAERAI